MQVSRRGFIASLLAATAVGFKRLNPWVPDPGVATHTVDSGWL